MNDECFTATSEEQLTICNMVSSGTPMAKAKAKIAAARKAAKKELPIVMKERTAKERKEAIAAEIKVLGGDVPQMSESVARFQQALVTARTNRSKVDDPLS